MFHSGRIVKVGIVVAAGAGFIANRPASAEPIFNTLLKQLVPTTQSSPAGSLASSVASITPAQTAAIDKLLTKSLDQQAIASDRAAAAPLIRKTLMTVACAKNPAALNSLNRSSLSPQTYATWTITGALPMSDMRYHDSNTCLDIMRLTNWTKPALNGLNVTAYYISPQSGEAKSQVFEFQKTTDGEWMIRTIGWAN